jgi:NADPH:quinone reductase-like Zn-dependent oxidoreductase
MNNDTKPKRPRKRWKRVAKWTLGTIFVALILWGFIAYWTSSNDCDRNAAVPINPMKAIVYCEYGPPDVLQLKEIEKPTPAENEVLIKVRAAGTNPLDGMHTGRARIVTGLRKPKLTRAGTDFAGIVEAVGNNVTAFKPGDEVFGAKTGAFAEYVCVRDDRAIVPKPSNVTFEEAGSVAVAATTALQGLRDKGKLQAGQRVLVNGASGGVGTFAVQIAKAYGAEVTGVCSGRNVDLVRSIGADHVIDYTKEDFTKSSQRYDLIYDLVCNHSFSERRQILNPNGICVMAGVGGSGWHDGILGRMGGELYAYVRSRFTTQKFVTYLAMLNKKDMTELAELMQSGKVKAVIDRTYKLNDLAAAERYLQEGHARGKVVVTVE